MTATTGGMGVARAFESADDSSPEDGTDKGARVTPAATPVGASKLLS